MRESFQDFRGRYAFELHIVAVYGEPLESGFCGGLMLDRDPIITVALRSPLNSAGGIVPAVDPVMGNTPRGPDLWVSFNPVADNAEHERLVTSDKPRNEYVVRDIDVPETAYKGHYAISAVFVWPLLHGLEEQVLQTAERLAKARDPVAALLGKEEPPRFAYHKRSPEEAIEAGMKVSNQAIALMQGKMNAALPHEFKMTGVKMMTHDYTCAGLSTDQTLLRSWSAHTPEPPVEFLKNTKVGDTPLIKLPSVDGYFSRVLSHPFVAVHRAADAQNLIEIGRELDPSSRMLDSNTLVFRGHSVNVQPVYIGVSPAWNQEEAEITALSEKTGKILSAAGDRSIILSVGRADYTKGVDDLVETIDQFFSKNSDKRDKVSFVIVLEPTRKGQPGYTEYHDDTVKAIHKLQKRWGAGIILHDEGIPHGELMHFMKLPNVVAVVGTARNTDGHNLVVREFANVNDPEAIAHSRGKSVILSDGLGASDILGPAGAFVVPRGSGPGAQRNWGKALEDFFATPKQELDARMLAMHKESIAFDGTRYVNTIAANIINVAETAIGYAPVQPGRQLIFSHAGTCDFGLGTV